MLGLRQLFIRTLLATIGLCGFQLLFSQIHDPFSWNRLPSDSEIDRAIEQLKANKAGDISVNDQVVDVRSVSTTRAIKHHNKSFAGKQEAHRISGLTIFIQIQGSYGSAIEQHFLSQNFDRDNFFFLPIGAKRSYSSLSEAETEYKQELLNFGSALGFAPRLSSSPGTPGGGGESEFDFEEYEDAIWTAVAGAIAAGLLVSIRARLKRRKKDKTKEKKEPKKSKKKQKEKKKEEAHYILQLNQKAFFLEIGEAQTLSITVWKITETKKEIANATIKIENNEKQLKLSPKKGQGQMKTELLLKDVPTKPNFNILVYANADGHPYHKRVSIKTHAENKIVVDTAPDNRRSLRPNVDHYLDVSARVLDAEGKSVPKLTKEIKFKPLSDWLDLSDAVLDNENIVIRIGASDPNANAAVSHPPETVKLSVFMDEVEGDKEPLQKEIELTLLDCKLETNADEFTFPVTNEKQTYEFKAFIDNADESKPWFFGASYKNYDEPDDPLTEIEIKKISDTEVKIKLIGPILLPQGKAQFLSKTLVITAQQTDKEEPLERHLNVMVSNIGLYLKKGVNAKNELAFTADKAIEKQLEFGLFKYVKETNQIEVDKPGLKNLEFELTSTKQEEKNLASVLEPTFLFDTYMGNIPNGRYTMTTAEEIPGFGDITTLEYLIKAPIPLDAEQEELFQTKLKLKVKSHGIGEEFPDWVKAYNECKYIIREYVPHGPEKQELSDILERRKNTLGVEGMIVLRNKIWKVASNLILAKGAEGYKSVDNWATAIETTLEWTVWAGDLAFNALAAYYLKGLGAMGASMVKATMIEALNFYIYEDAPIEVFIDRQIDKIWPLLMSVTKGRLISVDNIQLVCKNNRTLAWVIFIGIEFAYNLYRTKSVVEAAKQVARELRDEIIIRQLTKRISISAAKRGKTVVKLSAQEKKVIEDVKKHMVKGADGKMKVSKDKVLELMQDPAKIRTLKDLAPVEVQKAFQKTRGAIHASHDAKLKQVIAKKAGIKNPHDLKIDDFRTPGPDGEFNLNTDRDYRVLRRAGKTADGKDIWLEVPKETWRNESYDIFGKLTKKPPKYTSQEWAEINQQMATDKYHVEASMDYSDHGIDPATGQKIRLKPNILKVHAGKGTLIDPEGLGAMYRQKVRGSLDGGFEPEAFAQAKKGVKSVKKVWKGYKKQGFDLKEFPDDLQKAMKIIEGAPVTAKATPAKMKAINAQLKKLKYKDVDAVMDQIETNFKSLRNLKKPTIFQKIKGFIETST